MMYTFYLEKDSFLHSLDPRTKIIGSLSAMVAVLLFNHPAVMTALFLLILIAGRVLGKVEIGEQLKFLKPLLPLVILTIALWPLIYRPRTLGLLFGASFALRLLTLGLITILLLATTRQRELIRGFVKLGLPYELGLTVSIGLRYIPTLYILANNIMDAQKSRGWEVEKGNILVRLRKMSAVLIPLIVASLRTAHELSIALETRAFGASKKRTFLRDIKMRRRDYVALILILLLLGTAVYLRYSLGVGYVRIYG
ncbi:MAG: energy-coupling factor transport system permease protein [Thermococcaceae archaeon]|nr:energy-coupling factor transport system permease protein [Thermococcaceae archaeon]MDK2913389.1 energy-coupling factor transport system permease protein [Thermococcaceae archaeon]